MLLLLTSPLVSYNKLMKHLICTFVSKITDDEDEDDDDDDYYYYSDRPNCLYCPRVVFKYYRFIEDFSQSLRIDPSGGLLSCAEVTRRKKIATTHTYKKNLVEPP